MLTTVILEGVMGKRFGKEWKLAVNSPAEALRLINANSPGVFAWIKQNLPLYSRYRVICEYENGEIEELENETYGLERKTKSIRFEPIPEGAGGLLKAVIGIVLIVVGVYLNNPTLIRMGIQMAISGFIEALSPKPKQNDAGQVASKEGVSYYFDGPVNTSAQGVPVPLIYGRVLVGSHPISAVVTVDQIQVQ